MNAQLKIVFYLIVILISLVVLKLLSEIVYQIYKTDEPIWKMVWSDEFDYSGPPDSDIWDYELGDGCPGLCGWGNRELQHYTDKPENVRVEDGNLIIQVQHDTTYTNNYTSAKLRTKPEYSVKYGKVEVRAKNPSGRGIWPAIWMLPTQKKYGGWPKSGEIDIMEHVGYSADSIFGTVHTEAYNHLKDTHKSDAMVISDNEDAFHNYAIVWSPSKIDFFIDDALYFTFENENMTTKEWPFDQEFHLIINTAVGGNWGGKFGIDEIIVGQKFLIDYVRVYEDKSPRRLF